MQSVIEYFAAHNINDFVFIPNPGNAGDSLINAATFQVFDVAGLNYEVHSSRKLRKAIRAGKSLDALKGRIVVLGGGGAFTSNYTYSSTLIQAIHREVKQLVLLPCTVEGHETLLQSLGSNVTIFCRENMSLAHVQKQCNGPEILLHHDMAFSLNVALLLAQPDSGLGLRKRLRLYFRKRAMDALRQKCGTAELNAFRLDVEACGREIPPNNKDLSKLFSMGTQTREENFTAAKNLLLQVNMFDHIKTNRLHVGIASYLLGKRVEFHANSYFKNRAVYELSIEGRDPGGLVNFVVNSNS
ncbi:polysaccharide pyruvyl transferase family protein [Shewanella sp.]|uniref:polysaccharide pyruvyl transferase family protein n=1 Tax=Shewanella sp. TaxID=50422 RepID=UPI00356A91F3